MVILRIMFFLADKVFSSAWKNRLLLKFEMRKIPPPPPQKKKNRQKKFPAAKSICESSLIKVYWDLNIWWFGQREDSKKPYGKPTQPTAAFLCCSCYHELFKSVSFISSLRGPKFDLMTSLWRYSANLHTFCQIFEKKIRSYLSMPNFLSIPFGMTEL